MSSQDRPEPTGAASAPAREPEARAAEPRGESHTSANTASGGERAGAQQQGRRHARRRHQRSTSGGERETPTVHTQGRQPERELNLDELRELSELINEQGFTEFEIEREGFRLRISKQMPAAPITQAHAGTQPFVPPTITPGPTPGTTAPVETNEHAPTSTAEAAPTQPSAAEALHKITSPIVGTFYRSASPTAEPFVQVGSSVGPDSVVCIIEAMKLMNEILAETSGTVVEVYVENGQPVEFGQALFGIRK